MCVLAFLSFGAEHSLTFRSTQVVYEDARMLKVGFNGYTASQTHH